MDDLVPVSVIHFYDVRVRETLCGLRGFEHRSTKYARGVTCPACVGLLHQRLVLAQRLLETTPASIALIAQQAGFGSEVSLRHHFSKALRTTPARYRREFRRS